LFELGSLWCKIQKFSLQFDLVKIQFGIFGILGIKCNTPSRLKLELEGLEGAEKLVLGR